ncbi:hypothetical protein [Psychromonas sp.]|uniref:hypothetical protein n=1 Tax=Psychromonas sp. TaxID=1884585 RepID=UPI0039E51719
MNTLYIIRGPFGSGKTSFAHSISEHVVSCWDYYAEYGENKWNIQLKPHADKYCRNRTIDLMNQGMEKVAVTNSFSLSSDLDIYIDTAKKLNYRVFIVSMTPNSEYQRDVPESVIKDQITRSHGDFVNGISGAF